MKNIQTTDTVPLSAVELAYRDIDGDMQMEPATDIMEVGSIADPSTGLDLEIEQVYVNDQLEPLEDVVLVYVDENGQTFEQPVSELPHAGTLVDPETGEDLELDHARLIRH